MSRTYKTAPWVIRGYRAENRPVDADWRTRWDWQNSPPSYTRENDLWWNERPVLPWHLFGDRSHAKDRRILHKKMRAAERQAIHRHDADSIPRHRPSWWD